MSSTLSVFNHKGNKVKVSVPENERETEYQLMKLKMSFFVAELAILSQKYGIAIQSTGGVHFADFVKRLCDGRA
jgi:hypothetical protein